MTTENISPTQPETYNLEPTTAEKIKALPWSVLGSLANAVFNQLVFFGSGYVLFLNELGMSKSQIGSLVSLFAFLGVTAIVATPLINRIGYKRAFLIFWGGRKIIAGFMLAVPLVVSIWGKGGAFVFIAFVSIAFTLFRTVSETALLSWQQEYIPNSIRGKYTAYTNISVSLIGIGAVTFAGYIIEQSESINRFMVLFAVGVVFGLFSTLAFKYIPGGNVSQQERRSPNSIFGVSIIRKDRNFLLFIIGVALVILSTGPVYSFLPLFMGEKVGLGDGAIINLQVGALVGSVISGYLWGWAADRYGSKPVMNIGIFLFALLPVLWFVMPRQSEISFPIALVISGIQGIAQMGWAVGLVRWFFVSVIPPEEKSVYMGFYYAWISIVSGFGALLGGQVLEFAQGFEGKLLSFSIDAYSILFLLGITLALSSILAFRSVRADSQFTTGQFVGLFLRGNPLLAFESMISFHLARDERTLVLSTERLGTAKSPLTVHELLKALSDPRFYVRFEALVSIARRGQDPHLTRALVDLLQGPDPAFSVMSAWALGRVKDPEALNALRGGLASPYRSVRAYCARSLGLFDDQTSTSVILDALSNETDLGLKIAYASALGSLKETRALPVLIELLHEVNDPYLRMEMALGIARIVGEEHAFIHLMHRVEEESDTATSQALTGLAGRIKKSLPEGDPILLSIEACAHLFARGDLEQGVESLCALIPSLLAYEVDTSSHVDRVLAECTEKLRMYGAQRLEYLILGIYVLDGLIF